MTPLWKQFKTPAQELEGPRSLLGVQTKLTMTKKLRMHLDIKVPRNLVNAAMYDADLKDLKTDNLLTERTKKMKNFVTMGVNWTWSLDGHDKLFGF